MIVPLLILFYVFIKRFPAAVILVYGLFIFAGPIEAQEKEIEGGEETEIVQTEATFESERIVSSEGNVADFNKPITQVFTQNTVEHQYIRTAFLKLYILYNNFSHDRRNRSMLRLTYYQPYNYINHGNFKENSFEPTFCNCNNLLCSYGLHGDIISVV